VTYGPSVDREVAVAIGLVGTSVGNRPCGPGGPPLTTNKVALVVAPSHGEFAASAVGICRVTRAVQR
jgi:hypothetical protein